MWWVTLKYAQLLVSFDMENSMKMCELFKGQRICFNIILIINDA
jgi:hypothetical protein